MRNSLVQIAVLLSSLASIQLSGQQILIDKPVRAAQLTLFPDLNNENNYYYLPNKVQIATHADGKPMFSFIKYVKNTEAQPGQVNEITESNNAGGIVHAVISLNVTQDLIREAEQSLKRIKAEGKVVGPVIYKSGTVALISSFNKEGDNVKKVVGLGTAPILEGQKAAVSVHLNKEGSDILWATFETPTPDFSISFEMEIAGFLSPKKANITANWDRVYEHRALDVAIASPMLSAEIKDVYDELRDQGAITVTQVGGDEQMDKLVEAAYNQLMNLMFDKVAGSGIPDINQLFPGQNKSMLDRSTEMLQNSRKEAMEYNQRLTEQQTRQMEAENQARSGARQYRDQMYRERGETFTPPVDANADGTRPPAGNNQNNRPPAARPMEIPSMSVGISYQMKKQKRSGMFNINLNKYTPETRSNRFDENFGGLISKSKCATCFKRVTLDDPLYKQREIHVRIDGSISVEDFGKYINVVEVLMRKKHQNGETTVQAIQIDKNTFSKMANDFVMQYGWKGDDKREPWLEYEYKTKWSFFGGQTIESDWKTTESGAIALTPDFIRKPVFIEGDLDFFNGQNIRSVDVKIFYKINEKEFSKSVSLKSKESDLAKMVEIILPLNSEDFSYELAYFVKGKDQPLVKPRANSSYGKIYLDKL